MADGKVSFDAPDPSRLGTAAVNEVQESISILGTDDRFLFTFVGHDGTDARIESTAGGLILHAGRFFTGGSDQSPHMRLTPEGNLGIGIREPAAKLDVAGLIRTSEGIQFPDGSILKSANGFGSFSIFASSREGALPDSGASTVGMGSGPSGSAFDTSRLSKEASGVKQMTAAGGGIGRVYGTEGPTNTFYGTNTGLSNTTGDWNSFFGVDAGHSNTTGVRNSFFGTAAGHDNTTGNYNSFFGDAAGIGNTTGIKNSFFGINAGFSNTTGEGNAFFGRGTGYTNNGNNNSSFGSRPATTALQAGTTPFSAIKPGRQTPRKATITSSVPILTEPRE